MGAKLAGTAVANGIGAIADTSLSREAQPEIRLIPNIMPMAAGSRRMQIPVAIPGTLAVRALTLGQGAWRDLTKNLEARGSGRHGARHQAQQKLIVKRL